MVLLYHFVVEDYTISKLSKLFISKVFHLNAGHLSKCILTSSFLRSLDLLEKNNWTIYIDSKLFATFVFLAVMAAYIINIFSFSIPPVLNISTH